MHCITDVFIIILSIETGLKGCIWHLSVERYLNTIWMSSFFKNAYKLSICDFLFSNTSWIFFYIIEISDPLMLNFFFKSQNKWTDLRELTRVVSSVRLVILLCLETIVHIRRVMIAWAKFMQRAIWLIQNKIQSTKVNIRAKK